MAVDLRPRLTVASVIAHEEKFLLVEEYICGQRVLNQPAGHVEAKESLHRAVVRETLEETGWDFIPEAILGIYHYVTPDHLTFCRVTFSGRAVQYHPEQSLDQGIVQAVWLSREELLTHSLPARSPMVLRCIDDYLAGIRYPLSLLVSISTQQA